MLPSGRLVIGIIIFKTNLRRSLYNWIIAMIYFNPEDNAGSFDATDILTYHKKGPLAVNRPQEWKNPPACVTASGRLE
jgi:hypothetical protein